MKTKHVLVTLALTLSAGLVYAGFAQPNPVQIDLDFQIAFGDQYGTRTTDDDVSFIGCGTRRFDDGLGGAFRFGFCQAADADGNTAFCSTTNDALIDEMRANNSFSFITFAWDDDGTGNLTCTNVGFSTQSFYLPVIDSDDDSDSDSDSD